MNNIFWKLQSSNQSEELEVGSKEYNIYREHFKKDYETRELMTEQETVEHYKLNAWKSPMFSKIISLTLAYVETDVVRIIYYTGSEKDLIQTFLNTVKDSYFKEYSITHFGAEVLLPYLGIRVDKNKIKTSIPNDLKYKNLKPWNLTGTCVRNFYQGAGVYKPTLKELAYLFDLECSFIEPVDEVTYFQSGQLGKLRESAVDEIFTLVNVYRSIMGEGPCKDLNFKELLVEEVAEVKPSNFLALLWESQVMSPEVRSGLEKHLKKKKLTKRDREIVREIILGVYIQNDFINGAQDSKTTVEKKTKEVDNFLETI